MRAFARLTLLALLTGLATSRVTLVLHELLGHGAVALAFGGQIDELGFYVVGGGYVRYGLGDPGSALAQVATALGGIVLQLGLGAAALLMLRRLAPTSRWRVPVVGFAAIVILHGLYYLAVGVHHGLGDGWWIARRLGGWRGVVVWPASLVALAAAVPLGRRVAVAASAFCPGTTRGRRVLALVGAAGLAGAVHLGAALAEARLFPLPAHAATMRPQVDRDADAAVARLIAEAQRRGLGAPAHQAVERERARVRSAGRTFPLQIVLAVGLALAAALGVARGVGELSPTEDARARVPRTVPPTVLRGAGLACAAAFTLVVLLRVFA